ncbi:MAG: phosphocholine cytidylyltransferase family protein [Chromatiales bacterium]|nr:phosphocholine cytidylyltransferase family protein [Chromatiales bacterium]
MKSAVILAAGRGTRLAGHVGDFPKGFLRLGERPIIEESIDRLVQAGVRDVLVVTGHCAAHYDDLAARRPGLVRTVHNPRFAESGSMYSLYCARAAVSGPFLLLESDLVYEPRALTHLLEHPAADAILLSGPTRAGDEVYVECRDGNLVDMSKDRAALGPGVAGELVGISKISAALYARMCGIAERAFATSLRYDYETDCLVAAGREQPIACPVVPDLVWGEIDDPSHLARARDTVYPEVRRRTEAALRQPAL